jgi:uncharacterized protein YyaL (SSP411 family)
MRVCAGGGPKKFPLRRHHEHRNCLPNRLATEASPYLLQHKDNPVDWYPWGDEAFERARREDKPIFLSVGYSTCHWCHVMAHESFESMDVADVLNQSFVSIKVDREERPDVDRVYMTFVQATTGSGGWPMSVWLTPDLKPFYGGTYFPPTSRWQRPGFIDVLVEIARVWQSERDKVLGSADSIIERLRPERSLSASEGIVGAAVLDRAVREFAAMFDARRGGFGNAPKFPRPSELLFMLREQARTGASEPREMALVTLRAMALGGMRDHLGGGFHRYSVDGDWRVPHFEKMLYDQAQLVLAYVEASQLTGDLVYLDIAVDTLEYVRRDLTDPDGGFYSAEDADSVPPEQSGIADAHKTEGAFYIWRDQEIGDVLGSDAAVFRLRYGVLPDGNAPADPQGEFTGRNLLYTAQALESVAAAAGDSVDAVKATLERARLALFERREGRPRPHRDDKVLTAWNGLMIAALARASRMLPVESRQPPALGVGYLHDARRASRFIQKRLWNPETGQLLRRYRQGDAAVDGYAEDYAYLIFGLLELFQADGDPAWLEWAIELQRQQDLRFWDEENGGWFSTTGKDASVLLRLKEDYDGAEPAASSVSVLNLLVLSHLVQDDTYVEKIDRTLHLFGDRLETLGRAVPMMLAALSSYHAGMSQLVIVGRMDDEAMREMMQVAGRTYLPFTVVMPIVPEHRDALQRVVPWTSAYAEATADRSADADATADATAYLCRGFTCAAPTTSVEELRARLATRS